MIRLSSSQLSTLSRSSSTSGPAAVSCPYQPVSGAVNRALVANGIPSQSTAGSTSPASSQSTLLTKIANTLGPTFPVNVLSKLESTYDTAKGLTIRNNGRIYFNAHDFAKNPFKLGPGGFGLNGSTIRDMGLTAAKRLLDAPAFVPITGTGLSRLGGVLSNVAKVGPPLLPIATETIPVAIDIYYNRDQYKGQEARELIKAYDKGALKTISSSLLGIAGLTGGGMLGAAAATGLAAVGFAGAAAIAPAVGVVVGVGVAIAASIWLSGHISNGVDILFDKYIPQ